MASIVAMSMSHFLQMPASEVEAEVRAGAGAAGADHGKEEPAGAPGGAHGPRDAPARASRPGTPPAASVTPESPTVGPVASDDALSPQLDGVVSPGPDPVEDEEIVAKRARLQQLLRVIAVSEPSVRYTQGLNFVAALVLETVVDDCAAFNLTRRLFRQYDLTRLFAADMEAVGLRFHQFDRLLARHLPRLSAHLTGEQVSPAMYCSVWFLTLFSSFNAVDLPTTLLLWDRFLTSGWREIFRFALAIMKTLEPLVLGLPFETVLPVLQAPRQHIEGALSQPLHQLAALADSFDVTKRFLSEVENEYSARLATAGRPV